MKLPQNTVGRTPRVNLLLAEWPLYQLKHHYHRWGSVALLTQSRDEHVTSKVARYHIIIIDLRTIHHPLLVKTQLMI